MKFVDIEDVKKANELGSKIRGVVDKLTNSRKGETQRGTLGRLRRIYLPYSIARITRGKEFGLFLLNMKKEGDYSRDAISRHFHHFFDVEKEDLHEELEDILCRIVYEVNLNYYSVESILLYASMEGKMDYYDNSTCPAAIRRLVIEMLDIQPEDKVLHLLGNMYYEYSMSTSNDMFLVDMLLAGKIPKHFTRIKDYKISDAEGDEYQEGHLSSSDLYSDTGNEEHSFRNISDLLNEGLNLSVETDIKVLRHYRDVFEDIDNASYNKIFLTFPILHSDYDINWLDNGIYVPDVSTAELHWKCLELWMDKLQENGRMLAIVPTRALWSNEAVGERIKFVNNHWIKAIINLPDNLDGGKLNAKKIGLSIIVLEKNSSKIKMVDASDCFVKNRERKRNVFTESNIADICGYLDSEKEKISFYVGERKLRQADYNLCVDRYNIADMETRFVLKDFMEIKRPVSPTADELEEMISVGKSDLVIITPGALEDGVIFPQKSVDKNVFDEKYIVKYSKGIIEPSDLLMVKAGDPLKVAVYNDDLYPDKMLPVGSFYILRPIKGLRRSIDTNYLAAYLESDDCQKWLRSVLKGNKTKTVTVKDLENLPIPDDTIDQQHAIGEEYIEKLEAIREAKSKIEKLKKDIAGFDYEANKDDPEENL